MARVLFVVPPLVGHTNPTVSVARELAARGHEVAWVGHPGVVRPLLPPGALLFALDDRLPEDRYARATAEARAARGLAALKFLWEEFFVPLARAMAPGVEDAVARFSPDVLVVDQQAVAGALVARRRGLRWASFATTSAGVTDPLQGLPLGPQVARRSARRARARGRPRPRAAPGALAAARGRVHDRGARRPARSLPAALPLRRPVDRRAPRDDRLPVGRARARAARPGVARHGERRGRRPLLPAASSRRSPRRGPRR